MQAELKVVMTTYDGRDVPDWWETRLEENGVAFKIANCWTKEDLVDHAADADFVMQASGRRLLTAENIDVLDACGAIIVLASGTDMVNVSAATRKGIVVVNTPDCMTEPVADGTISLLFSVVKQVPLLDRAVRAGQLGERLAASAPGVASPVGPQAWPWSSRAGERLPQAFMPVRGFKSATLGLVGFGRIGRAVARKLSGFEMNILACDPYVDAQAFEQLKARSVGLVELLRESDFVCLTCPLTEETYHLIGEQELRLMRPKAVLINTSRGSVVDEKALYRALAEGWIARAGLDVTETEPIEPDNPLLELDKLVLTPHNVGNSDAATERGWWEADEALFALAHGRWPRSVVNRGAVAPRWTLI